MNWLINRLKERTTWLGIFTLLSLAGIKLEPEFREVIINAILAVAAVVAFVYRENIHERSTDLDQPSQATALPPIELTGQSESIEPVTKVPSTGFDDSVPHNRRVTDKWLHDVPSVPGFKVPPPSHSGSVGWNDES